MNARAARDQQDADSGSLPCRGVHDAVSHERFSIDPAAPTFKSEVHAYEKQAQSDVLSSVKQHGSQAAATGSAVKVLRGHMRAGTLDSYLHMYRRLREQGQISDSTPSSRLP